MSENKNKIKQLAKEASDLNIRIKLDTIRLKKIKKQLVNLMINENIPKVNTDKSNIIKSTWNIRFSTQLRKEFNKLDDKKKEELLNKGLLKIQYKLNSKKYEEIKNKQEKTELDKYVIDRKNIIFLTIRLNEQTKNELSNEMETKKIDLEDHLYLDDFILEEEEVQRLVMEEGNYDPGVAVHSDDDKADLTEVEKQDLGISDNERLNELLKNNDEEKIEEEKYSAEKDREERLKDKKFDLIQLKKEQLNKIKNETDKLEKEIKEEEEKIKKNYADNLDDEIPF